LKFLLQAHGSLEELIDDLNVCFDEKYFPAEDVESLKQLGWRVHNVINGYGRYLRKRKTSQESTLRETPEPYGTSEDADPITDLPF